MNTVSPPGYEVPCFNCFKRILEESARKVRLTRPEGLYCDGVDVNFCADPDCRRRAETLDAKYGKPEQRKGYGVSER